MRAFNAPSRTANKRVTANELVFAIGCLFLDVYRANGTWYMSYHNNTHQLSSTINMGTTLSSKSFDAWVEEGRAFVKQAEASIPKTKQKKAA